MKKLLPIFLVVFSSTELLAGVLLPLHSLRDQEDTSHCWSYATSHLLEARALVRDSLDITINVEKDVKYWLDMERMLYIYRTKNDFYLGEYEGGWQIEYWESFLKHGKHIYKATQGSPDLWYQPLIDYFVHLPFMPEVRPQPDSTLESFNQAQEKLLTEIKSEGEALTYITNYLDRYYGKPVTKTKWFQQEIDIAQSAELILGSDFKNNHDVQSVVLVKPVRDGNWGWVRYLDERYWGYRYDQAKIFKLIEMSLDHQWPVTFDNVFHAMTIIGYELKGEEMYYAVADSVPGKITWYSQKNLLSNLNLLTFFKESIPGALPHQSRLNIAKIPQGIDIDKFDHVDHPPR